MKRFYWVFFGLLLAATAGLGALVLLPASAANRREEDRIVLASRELAALKENPSRLPTRQYIERLKAASDDITKEYSAAVAMFCKYDDILEKKRIFRPGISAQEFKARYAEVSASLEKEFGGRVFQPYGWETSTAVPSDEEMLLVEKRLAVLHALAAALPQKEGVKFAKVETKGPLQPGFKPKAGPEEQPPVIPPGADCAVRFRPLPARIEFDCRMQSLGRRLADLTRASTSNLLITVREMEIRPLGGAVGKKDPRSAAVRVIMELEILDPEIYRR